MSTHPPPIKLYLTRSGKQDLMMPVAMCFSDRGRFADSTSCTFLFCVCNEFKVIDESQPDYWTLRVHQVSPRGIVCPYRNLFPQEGKLPGDMS